MVDPWGAVIAQASDKTNQVIYADIDLDYIKTVRMGMPVANHRRPDIYGECTGLFSSPGSCHILIESTRIDCEDKET